MKKLLFLAAAVTVAFSASADDLFLYWMVGNDATLDGVTLDSSQTYYAAIKASDGASYLSLYDGPNSGSTPYSSVQVSPGKNMGVFAGITGTTASYWVELYNDSSLSADKWVGRAELAWNETDNVTRAGMTVAIPALASQFSSVPEPTSGMLLLFGVAGLALRRRKMRRV